MLEATTKDSLKVLLSHMRLTKVFCTNKQLKMQVGHETGTLMGLVAFSVPYRALSRNPTVSDKTLDIVGLSGLSPTNKDI